MMATEARPPDELPLRAWLENWPEAMVLVDAQQRIQFSNPALERSLGWTGAELGGKPLGDLVPLKLPEALEAYRKGKGPGAGAMAGALVRTKDGADRSMDLAFGHVPVARETMALVLLRDLSDRHHAERETHLKIEELERSNKDLERFAYVASHDLQEPLREVVKFLELLERRTGPTMDSDAREWTAYAAAGAKRMQKLIDSLLAYSRIGSRGKPFEAVEGQQALTEALSYLEGRIEESGAVVSFDRLPRVVADPVQLVQIFQNLVGNAIKFRRPDAAPEVHVSADRKGDEWIFRVRDNGIGMAKEDLPRLFVMFNRLGDRAAYPGTGIGLAIVKRIVDRHGGRVWVDSKPGKGSSFFFALPVRDAAGA